MAPPTVALVLLFTSAVQLATAMRTGRAAGDNSVAVDCNQAPMCDCSQCSPEACVVHTEDFKSCKWPDSVEFCTAWLEEQCGPSAHTGGGLAGIMGGGLPAGGKPLRPTGGQPLAGILGGGLPTLRPAGGDDSTTTLEPDAEECGAEDQDAPVRTVKCDIAPMCDCGNCNPSTCIVSTKDGEGCMWPLGAAFCAAWKKEQCETGPVGRLPLPGQGRLPLPGWGGQRPQLKPVSRPTPPGNPLPGMEDLAGVRLKPVARQTTTLSPGEDDGPQDPPLCKQFDLKKPCNKIMSKRCPISCKKLEQ